MYELNHSLVCCIWRESWRLNMWTWKRFGAKAYGGVDVYIQFFLTAALVGCEWSVWRPGHFTSGAHWIGGWVGPKPVLYDVERRKISPLPGIEYWPVRHSARSQLALSRQKLNLP
jgi:hypothetical protein